MAFAIYFEARGETPYQQALVANTIINRVESNKFPDTICGVIKQKAQFSFYWDGRPDKITETQGWLDSLAMARHYLSVQNKLTPACHYAKHQIDNYWTKTFTGKREGTHIFYEGGC
jgi:spore germination cell wall hydrolase CwlJ-like protein